MQFRTEAHTCKELHDCMSMQITFKKKIRLYLPTSALRKKSVIIINTHGRFAIAFLPLTTRLLTELFEAVFIEKSSG